MHILRRDWEKGLGEKLEGKLHIYVGDMDNYYLNNAVYLAEEFLKSTANPPYDGEVDYGDRAEHCWNGDHDAAERLLAPALPPDVHARSRGADAEDGAARRRPEELAVLTTTRLAGGEAARRAAVQPSRCPAVVSDIRVTPTPAIRRPRR